MTKEKRVETYQKKNESNEKLKYAIVLWSNAKIFDSLNYIHQIIEIHPVIVDL
jgi:hypothetical protein